MSNERLNIDRRKKVDINLNIAPLIDVVFQLLLFFALTSYFVSTSGIEVSLPKSGSSSTVEKNHIEIYINNKKQIYYNNSFVKISDLKNMLISIEKKRTVILKADKSIDIGYIVKIIDIIKQNNFNNLIIATTHENNNE